MWPGNFKAAEQIFEFFEVEYTRTGDENFVLFEGMLNGHELQVYLSTADNDDFGVQFRTRGGRSRGGVLIRSSKGIEFKDDATRGKMVIVRSTNGVVEIDKFGVHATIYRPHIPDY